MSERLLRIEDLAAKLQVPKSWIYERTRSKQIPYLKVGKYIRFQESEIDTWISKFSSLKNEKLEKRRP